MSILIKDKTNEKFILFAIVNRERDSAVWVSERKLNLIAHLREAAFYILLNARQMRYDFRLFDSCAFVNHCKSSLDIVFAAA